MRYGDGEAFRVSQPYGDAVDNFGKGDRLGKLDQTARARVSGGGGEREDRAAGMRGGGEFEGFVLLVLGVGEVRGVMLEHVRGSFGGGGRGYRREVTLIAVVVGGRGGERGGFRRRIGAGVGWGDLSDGFLCRSGGAGDDVGEPVIQSARGSIDGAVWAVDLCSYPSNSASKISGAFQCTYAYPFRRKSQQSLLLWVLQRQALQAAEDDRICAFTRILPIRRLFRSNDLSMAAGTYGRRR